ncbi:Uncaracterized surface protein containing fasciclin (FAS1) repeats [Streptosporangium subroseum]|uniref:Uncaracterized surface protein containing fasciclin (FAS1) repeats n=1 Tax=Streptosporangium subroseum TaxID=106412 RepID=A0A239B1B1_9ACTN|nr:fasciclin domain-containing protein [Streptosporangium subroseum]SNS01362.1 Uncaracterized surface protein containing fasciclin (FAS1) repeats [Streptosporangium subroseum]
MKARFLTLPLLAVAVSLTAACGGDTSASPAASSAAPAPSTESPMVSDSASSAAMPFGAACSAVPASGEGSFTGMADDPVATAASNNPLLSTLVTAVQKAGLGDTLNSAEDITVFAPTNDAFAKIPKETLDKVLADKKTLTDILTYHVVQGRKTPADLANGSFTTLQGGTVTTTGSGEDFKANGAAVLCGNVSTRNATVYIIDTVLMPKS